jgi:hypothetical protein
MPKRKTAKKRAVKKRQKFLFIPYPLLIFLMLCIGAYLTAWTFNAHADDVIVNAIVKDKPITAPAVITPSINGEHFSAVPIEINGTCPPNAAYVEIFRNGFLTGSAICQNGQFDSEVDLFAGMNKIEAHSFNLTDDEGPVSSPVIVYYDPLATITPDLKTGTSKKTPPLLLKTAFVYKGYYVNDEVRWPLEISGGAAPYALNVDWGDGNNSIISRKDAGQFDISHTYKNPGGFHGSYTIKVQVSDTEGNYTYLEFFVIVNSRASTAISGNSNIYSKGPPTLGGLHEWVWLAWPIYGSVFLMAIAYKLGEREEILLLRKRHQLKGS